MLGKGRIARKRELGEVRELEIGELELLREPRKPASIVDKLRDSHRRICWLISTGMSLSQVAEVTGYSYSRICSYNTDPACQELIAGFRKDVHAARIEATKEFERVATGNMLEAELQAEEHLARGRESGDLVPLRQLIPLIADRADRFGYAKRQTNVNVNVNFADELERRIQHAQRTLGDTPGAPRVLELSAASQSPVLASQDAGERQPIRRRF